MIMQKQPAEVFYKKATKHFAIFTGKKRVGVSFLKKLQTFSPATLLKRDSSTGAFL